MGEEPRNLVLLVGGAEAAFEGVALALTRARIPLVHGSGPEEAAVLARRQRTRIRCVLHAPSEDPVDVAALSRALALGADLDPPHHIVVGPRPEPAIRMGMNGAGIRQALWEPFDDATLCYVVRAALNRHVGRSRRACERVPTRLPISVLARGRRIEAFATTLSAGGAFVETNAELKVGVELRVKLRLPDGPLSAWVSVRHSSTAASAPPRGFGVAFRRLSAQDEDRLRCYVRVRRALFEL